MKKFLWGFLIAFLILLLAAIVAPNLISWNNYQDVIINKIKDLSGQDLKINGDIQVSLLPTPTILLNKISLSYPTNFSSKQLLTIKSAEIKISLNHLITGQLKIQKVKLIDPVIELETFKSEGKNWDLKTRKKNRTVKAIESDSKVYVDSKLIPSTSLKNLTIINGTVNYHNKDKNVFKKIEAINVQIKTDSLNGPFEAQGHLSVQGVKLSYNIKTSQIIQTKPMKLDVELKSTQEQLFLYINSNVTNPLRNPKLTGKIKGKGENLSNFVKLFPDFSHYSIFNDPFSFNGLISASKNQAEIKNLNISMGKTSILGDFTIDFHKTINFALHLAIKNLNTRHWIKKSQKNSTTSINKLSTKKNTSNSQGVKKLKPYRFTPLIPENINGSVILTIDTLNYKRGIIRDLNFNADIKNQKANLNQLSFQFPGGSDFNLSGKLTTTDNTPAFKGNVDISVNDLHNTILWLGANTNYIPSNRFRNINVISQVLITQKQAQATSFKIKFDNSRLTGAATLAFSRRPSFGLTIFLDRLNLDSYILNPDLIQEQKVSPSLQINKVDQKSKYLYKDSIFPLLNILGTFDANIDAKIKKLTYKKRKIQNTALNATIHNGNIEFRNFRIGNVAGTSAQIKGKLKNITGIPSAEKLNIEIKAQSLQPLIKLFNISLPINPKRLGAFSINTKVNGSLVRPQIEVNANLAKSEIIGNGTLSALPVGSMFDLAIRFRHRDIGRLARNLGLNYRPAKKIGAANLSLQVFGNPEIINFADLKGSLGNLPIDGAGSLDFSKEKPKLTANIKTGTVIIENFIPVQQRSKTKNQIWQPLKKLPVSWPSLQDKTSHPYFLKVTNLRDSRKGKINFMNLNALDAAINIKSKAFFFKNYFLQNPQVIANIYKGKLEVKELSGKLFNGDLKGSGTISPNDTNQISAKIKLSNTDLNEMLLSIYGKSHATGLLNLGLNLKTKGQNIKRFTNNLNGTANFNVQKLNIKTKNIVFSRYFDLMTHFNKSKPNQTKGNSKITGSVKITDGIAQIKNLMLTSALGQGEARGYIDLPKWHININGDIKLTQNFLINILKKNSDKEKNIVPFSLFGQLNSPKIEINTDPFLGKNLDNNITNNSIIKKAPKKVKNFLKRILEKELNKRTSPKKSKTEINTKTKIDPSELFNKLFK